MSQSCATKNQAPFRVPCVGGGGGWTTGGGAHQHKIPAHTAIAAYNNVTKVNDWRDPGHPDYNAAGITPFPKEAPSILALSGGTCLTAINSECRPVADGPCPPYPADCAEPCTPWSEADIVACVGSILGNCYESAETTVDLSRCRKRGFKIVQARKVWHGRFGFNHVDGCGEVHEGDCDCTVEPERSAPTTKYLTRHVTVDLNETIISNPGDETEDTGTRVQHLEYTVSINRYSGVKTLTACSRSISISGGGVFPGYGELTSQTPEQWPASFTGYAVDFWQELDFGCGKFLIGISSMTGDEMETIWTDAIAAALGEPSQVDIRENTATATQSDTLLTFEASASLINGQDADPVNPSVDWTIGVSIEVELADPYTRQQHQDDVDALLAEWDLADDAVYPWREDGYVTTGPLVTRDEYPTPHTPDYPGACEMDDDDGGEAPWNESGYTAGVANAPYYSGDIIGSPLPAGYSGHWDLLSKLNDLNNPGHQTWRTCTDSGGTHWYVYSYGAKSGISNNGDFSDQAVPATSTQWTNNYDAARFPPGAWRINDGGVTWAQKGAWIKEDAPSQNFFRPCGEDREARDQTTIDCEGDEAARTGDLRWPDAWPICGRIRVSEATEDSGTVTITLAAAANLETGDVVDFTNAAGSVTDSNKTITVLDATHFTYTGTVPTGAFVVADGAPAWHWYDDEPKGQFVVHVWTFNYRDYQERDRRNTELESCGEGCELEAGAVIREHQATHGMPREVNGYTATTYCLPRNPCASQICAITPNGETFENAIVLDFGDALADDRYGARWHAEVQFLMDDLLWEAPHKPCEENDSPPPDYVDFPGAWLEDDGTCQSDVPDTIKYYARRPVVEALSALPSGAPTLPAGIYIGWLTLEDLDTATPPDGNVAAPPGNVGTAGEIETEWTLRMKQEACVCASGRFATEYEANRALCYA